MAGTAWLLMAAPARAQAQVQAPRAAATPAAVQPAAVDSTLRMRLSSAQVLQAFQHVDRNRDGRLTRPEMGPYPRVQREFERIDANRDGVLTPFEFEEALQRAS